MSVILPAASVLLVRGREPDEVFLVRRSEQLSFFGGFWAFPGGKVAAEDSLLARGDDPCAVRRVTAARELLEETGVLLARRGDGSHLPAGPDVDHLRQELLAGRISFAEMLARHGLDIHAHDFSLIGHITTPEFVPARFDTTFFVCRMPPLQRAEVWPGELAEGAWLSADAMLTRWERAECLLSPPTAMTLQALRARPAEEAGAALAPLFTDFASGKLHPIFFAPAVQLVPLRTMALPPSTHTNAYLVGTGPVYLIDPGPHDPPEQRRLFDLLDEQARLGRPLSAVLLTHHHPDHVGAATACADRYGAPVWAHPVTAELLQGKVPIRRHLHDGDRLDLGPAPDGNGRWHLEAIFTPGHAAGHLAFFEPRYRLLFVGDLVSTLSSVIVAPPEGDLSLYLASLQRLREVPCRLLLPGHGNASSRSRQTIDECLRHRARREKQLLDALAQGERNVDDLAAELYRGLPEGLMRFARLQVLGGLLKLQKEGRVAGGGPGPWRLQPAGV